MVKHAAHLTVAFRVPAVTLIGTARLMTTDQGLALMDPDGQHVTLLQLPVPDLGAALESGTSLA
jgi:hypothetical protein